MAIANGKFALNGVDVSDYVVKVDVNSGRPSTLFAQGGLVSGTSSVSFQEDYVAAPSLYAEGYTAAQQGGSVAACPFSPSDPEGSEWRKGWIAGEQRNRMNAGTYDHTPDEYAAYKQQIGWGEDDLADPVVEILGGYDELPSKEPEPWVDPALWDAAYPSWAKTATATTWVPITQQMLDECFAKTLAFFDRAFLNVARTIASKSDVIAGLKASFAALDEPRTYSVSYDTSPLLRAEDIKPALPLADWLKVGTSAVIPSVRKIELRDITGC